MHADIFKLFAQAHLDPEISHFATSDKRSLKILKTIKSKSAARFDLIDIHTPYNEQFGELPFE